MDSGEQGLVEFQVAVRLLDEVERARGPGLGAAREQVERARKVLERVAGELEASREFGRALAQANAMSAFNVAVLARSGDGSRRRAGAAGLRLLRRSTAEVAAMDREMDELVARTCALLRQAREALDRRLREVEGTAAAA